MVWFAHSTMHSKILLLALTCALLGAPCGCSRVHLSAGSLGQAASRAPVHFKIGSDPSDGEADAPSHVQTFDLYTRSTPQFGAAGIPHFGGLSVEEPRAGLRAVFIADESHAIARRGETDALEMVRNMFRNHKDDVHLEDVVDSLLSVVQTTLRLSRLGCEDAEFYMHLLAAWRLRALTHEGVDEAAQRLFMECRGAYAEEGTCRALDELQSICGRDDPRSARADILQAFVRM
eukprot:TRINITY_DN35134_c0_g1_i1.p1 TRINITY_DN35134_c0_g1~~TRINITY_DN35134_c0_g1_i1.p1  ORF type:complete len:242 (-),score=37.15 TRINITY_DN35134_c0_g1_i1:34-732(-)